jgi:hypothetical protein
MDRQEFYLGRIDGINIIPSEDIAPGFKRTVGSDISINKQDYEYLKPIGPKTTIIMLGLLKELTLPEDYYKAFHIPPALLRELANMNHIPEPEQGG